MRSGGKVVEVCNVDILESSCWCKSLDRKDGDMQYNGLVYKGLRLS